MPISRLAPISAHTGQAFNPVGAHVHDGGVTYRVWAPRHEAVRVATGDGTNTRYVLLERETDGFFSGRDEEGRAGDLYWLQVDGRLLPDPASRFQPRGVEGPSQVIDPHDYAWGARTWRRPPLHGRVIYELHVGTFTPEGTFAAAMARLDAIADLGANAIELMPLGDFAGDRNWGYDGVMLFAPARCYGTPHQLRAVIDAAHARGLAVILDVVYNHLGPSGNVLPQFAREYFHDEHDSPWGAALNFDGANSAQVRQFFLQNACMWFDEYRVDGLRLDAVHAIKDESERHIIAEIAAAAHARGGFVIAEDDRNDARIITPPRDGGWGVDGMWADDFHHTVRVAATRQREAHFANYSGAIDEWVETLREGWFYHGQFYRSWMRPRGTPAAHLEPERFVFCISNHDQVGNRPLGDRLSEAISLEHYRAFSLLLCLVPYTPLLFMGQEWAARTPFPFFTDFPGRLGETIGEGRLNEFRSRSAMYAAEMLARMPPPQAEATFQSAKLDWSERERAPHAGVLALYRECLRLRRENAVFQSAPRTTWSVEKLGAAGVALRWRDPAGNWELRVALAGEMVAPGSEWRRVLSSNEERFGGTRGSELTAPVAVLWRAT